MVAVVVLIVVIIDLLSKTVMVPMTMAVPVIMVPMLVS